jgi:hypothetical protein
MARSGHLEQAQVKVKMQSFFYLLYTIFHFSRMINNTPSLINPSSKMSEKNDIVLYEFTLFLIISDGFLQYKISKNCISMSPIDNKNFETIDD